MTQHYTRNTTAILQYCPTCRKNTMHAVYDRRVGHCLENHVKTPDKKPQQTVNKNTQGNLF